MKRVEYKIRWEMWNRLGLGDCRSWDDAILGVWCTRCGLIIMAWRDREGWLEFIFLGNGRERERWEDLGETIMRNWNLREFRVQVKWPLLIRQVLLPIRQLQTPKGVLLNPIRQAVPLASHICSYPPYLFPSSSPIPLSLPSSQNTKLSHPSLSLHAMIMR